MKKIGNGEGTDIWYDTWCDLGPLSNFITKRDIFEARLCMKMKVAEMLNNGALMWPDGWSNRWPKLNSIQVPSLYNHCSDVLMSRNAKGMDLNFSIHTAWEDIRIDIQKVIWHKHVWYS